MSPKRIEVEQIFVSLSNTSHYLIGKNDIYNYKYIEIYYYYYYYYYYYFKHFT